MMSISEHHAKCIEALQRIALLGDTGSNEYKKAYARYLPIGPVGQRVVEDMREVANDVVGNIPLSPVFTEVAGWKRTVFSSLWDGPEIELFVVQNYGSDESWSWTARGWRQPDECDGADRWGWVSESTREACEKAALAFYMEKDE